MINQHNSLIGFLVYDAQRAIAKSLETALKPYEITPGQWNLINQLDQAGELSQKELATITHKEQATITRYLDTLERKGLVVRNKHKTDRRSHVVSTTDKAHELIRTVLPLTAITANRLIEGIDQQDIDTFVTVLAALKENAEAILAQLGITPSALIQMTYSQVVLHNGLPFSARIPAKAPTAVGRMTQEQLDAELRKGVESFNKGSFTADEIDQALAKEFGI